MLFSESNQKGLFMLFLFSAMAALVWLFTRNDLRSGMKRVVALLIALCVFHEFIEQ